MIARAEIDELHRRSPEELRELAAFVAGALAQQMGAHHTAETFRRVAAALDAHIPRVAA
jgi:hypothetical protein